MQYDWNNKTILVVEDSETVNMFFEAALRRTQVKIIWAKTGVEAIELFKSIEKIDIILMDLQLPEMDGFDATSKIREIDKRVPIIAQTAHIVEKSKEQSLKVGCTDYITKPIRLSVLLSVIDKYIHTLTDN